jgi:hypothetical protein
MIGHFGTFDNARRIVNNRDIANSLREMFEPCGKGAVVLVKDLQDMIQAAQKGSVSAP